MQLRPLILAALGVAALLVTACTGGSTPDPTSEGETPAPAAADTFRIGTDAAPATINPLMGHEAEGTTWFYESLVQLVGDELVPLVAAEMPQADDDATTWTVTLRTDVTFSDGTALDAGDVVATYERALDPAAASPWASELARLSEVAAPATDTVVFTLDAPDAFFGDRLTIGIIPSEVAEAEQGSPLTESSLNETPVGSGPYVLESWADRNDLVLQARDDWWGGEPEIRQIILTAVPDATQRAQMVIDGALDGTMIGPAQAAALLPPGERDGPVAEDEAVTVLVNETADARAVSLPMDHPFTADPLVRRALNFAVDREGIVEGVLDGYAIPVDNPFPHSVGDFAQPSLFAFDPDAAAALLDEAGWLAGEDGMRSKDGEQARLTLMYPSSDTGRRDQAQVIVDQFGDVGIDATAEGLSWDLIEPRMSTDALVFAGGTPGNPDGTAWNWMACELAGDGFNNPGHYCNEELDRALVEGRSTTDPDAQQAAYARANEIYADDPGFVFLNTVSRTYLLRADGWEGVEPHLEGHVHSVSWGPWWNIAEWTR
ncbi:MAG: ABC transporter substrate-binding protein [Propionibacterium sp.]|nr:ABC transporter substrate-binding protein [Propionibacterium sp.]